MTDDQLERARGTHLLRLTVAPSDEAAWRRLRRTLRLPRADDTWLRQRVPGVVRRGARLDLEPLLEKLLAAGFEATLSRRR